MTSRISLTGSWIQIATGASIVSCDGAIEVAYSDTAPAAGDNGRDDRFTRPESLAHASLNGVVYSTGNRVLRHLGIPGQRHPIIEKCAIQGRKHCG